MYCRLRVFLAHRAPDLTRRIFGTDNQRKRRLQVNALILYLNLVLVFCLVKVVIERVF